MGAHGEMSIHSNDGDRQAQNRHEHSQQSPISRRAILRGIGGGTFAATGLATGTENRNKNKRNHDSDSNDRHIVGANTARAARDAQQRADSVRHVTDLDVRILVSGTYNENARKGLASRNDVAYVVKDRARDVESISLTDDDVESVVPWGIDRGDADVAHDTDETGAGVDVAVVDTGIDSDHPDLESNLGTGKAVVECTGLSSTCNEDWDDDYGHGTGTAGIVGAVANSDGVLGVAPEVTLHAVKVCDATGLCYDSDTAEGLRWIADQGYGVANISLGSPSEDQPLRDAGRYAYENGVLLVASAGNQGPCTDCVWYPAAHTDYIAVSATTIPDELAGFSSQGPEIELAGPGDDICVPTMGGGYDTGDGTSFAAPHVAGAGAQLLANGYVNATDTADASNPGGARGQLRDTAEDIGLPDPEQGYGLYDVAASLGLDSSDDGTGDGTNCP